MRIRGIELWLLGALCFGPLLLAAALYYGPWFDPHELPRLEAPGRHLFEPPLTPPPLALDPHEGAPAAPLRWSLIYATMARCDAACTEELERLRAVHLALGRRADRVRRVLISPGQGSVDDPALWTGRLDSNDAFVAAVGAERLRDGEILVVDPLGNVVLAYPAGAAQRDLLDDLKRLLEVSRIG